MLANMPPSQFLLPYTPNNIPLSSSMDNFWSLWLSAIILV